MWILSKKLTAMHIASPTLWFIFKPRQAHPIPSMATACQSMTMTGTSKMGFFFLIIMISQRNMSTASLLKNKSHVLFWSKPIPLCRIPCASSSLQSSRTSCNNHWSQWSWDRSCTESIRFWLHLNAFWNKQPTPWCICFPSAYPCLMSAHCLNAWHEKTATS